MIKERICSYELSMLLQEKGFDEECDYFYEHSTDEPHEMTRDEIVESCNLCIKAPTHQMACDWIYENYGLYVQIFLYVTLSTNKKDNSIIKKIRWTFDIVTKFPEKGPYQYYEPVREEFDSQYEATEAGLKYILNKI